MEENILKIEGIRSYLSPLYNNIDELIDFIQFEGDDEIDNLDIESFILNNIQDYLSNNKMLSENKHSIEEDNEYYGEEYYVNENVNLYEALEDLGSRYEIEQYEASLLRNGTDTEGWDKESFSEDFTNFIQDKTDRLEEEFERMKYNFQRIGGLK